jgi:hypothetical protein
VLAVLGVDQSDDDRDVALVLQRHGVGHRHTFGMSPFTAEAARQANANVWHGARGQRCLRRGTARCGRSPGHRADLSALVRS